jgi:glycosyltransferase involved in cell wall biosynthesis
MPANQHISVVVPVLNGAPYLATCLESLCASRGVTPEIIVVDGGSTDGTLKVARGFGNRIARIVTGPDHGQADAIRKGFEAATAPYITWLGADDIVLPEAYAQAAAILDRESRCAIAYGDVLACDGNLVPLQLSRFPGHFTSQALLQYQSVSQPGALYRASAIAAVGGISTALHYIMDLELYLRLHDGGYTSQHTGHVAARFRLGGASKSATQAARFVDEAIAAFKPYGARGAVGIKRARRIRLRLRLRRCLRASGLPRCLWPIASHVLPACFSDATRGRILGLCVKTHFGGILCGPHVHVSNPAAILIGRGARIPAGTHLHGPFTVPAAPEVVS